MIEYIYIGVLIVVLGACMTIFKCIPFKKYQLEELQKKYNKNIDESKFYIFEGTSRISLGVIFISLGYFSISNIFVLAFFIICWVMLYYLIRNKVLDLNIM
ncbi:hypothetical protein [Romboutsia sp.]|uniref:hypothetical protein n=1 Tax=Romboutsia sp. TaxID=1965302 RepID=UPI003F2E6C9D